MVTVAPPRPMYLRPVTADSAKKTRSGTVVGSSLLAPVTDINPFSEDDDTKRRRKKRNRQAAAEDAIVDLEEAYQAMLEGIDTETVPLDEASIKKAIAKTEETRGAYTKPEKQQLLALIRKARDTRHPELVRAISLELGLGLSPTLEKAVFASLGKVMIHHRDAKSAIKAKLNDPNLDPNLAAHLRAVSLLNGVETMVARIQSVTSTVKRWLTV